MLHVTTDGDGYEDWRKSLLRLYQTTPGCLRTGDFTLASGRKSDLYIDSREVSLSSRGLQLIGSCILEVMATELRNVDYSVVGGMTMGADPVVAAVTLLSACWGNPVRGFLIRKEAKAHGTGRRVEGPVRPRDRAILLEDVTTTGGTLVDAARVARAFGCEPVAAITVVDREEGGAEALAAEGVPLYSVLRRKDLVKG